MGRCAGRNGAIVNDGAMVAFGEALRWAAAASLGVYAGAMLTEAGVLVPFWRALVPADFLRWYAANAARLNGFFGPLTIAAVLSTLLAAATSLWQAHPGRWPALLAAVVMAALLAGYFAYFEQANASFARGTIAPDDVPSALARWQLWHNVRTAFSLLAFVAALSAARATP